LKDWETMRRIKVVNTRGIESYVWESTTSVDHFCFATLYYRLAVGMHGTGAILTQGSGDVPVIIRKKDGDYLNIKELMESRADE